MNTDDLNNATSEEASEKIFYLLFHAKESVLASYTVFDIYKLIHGSTLNGTDKLMWVKSYNKYSNISKQTRNFYLLLSTMTVDGVPDDATLLDAYELLISKHKQLKDNTLSTVRLLYFSELSLKLMSTKN